MDRAAAWRVLLGWLGEGDAARRAPVAAAGAEHAADAELAAVAELAIALRLGPMLYCRWLEAGVALPAAVNSRLRAVRAAASSVALAVTRTLEEIIQAFDAAGIRAIVLKGLALSETVYPAEAPRPSDDLDLLVQPEDVARATACLERLGYRAQPAHNPADDRRFGGEVTFTRADGRGRPVELHWHLLNYAWSRRAMRVPVETWWRRAEPLVIGRVRAWRLAPEDTIIYLALHSAIHHTYDEPLLLLDLDRLIRHGPALDWDVIVRRACAYRVRRILYFTLEFTRRLFDSPVPEHVLAALRPPGPVRQAVERLADPLQDPLGRRSLGSQNKFFLHFALLDRWQDRLRGIGRVFFPGREWIAARYGVSRPLEIALYGAWHPLRAGGLGLLALGQLAGRSRVRGRPRAAGVSAGRRPAGVPR